MKKIPNEIKEKVIELKQKGLSYNIIAEQLNIGKGSISNICKEVGLGQKLVQLTPEKIEECQKLYDEIGNIKKVAKLSGISYDRLRNVIQSKSITPQSSYDRVKARRKRTKEQLVAYKGGKCEICGYDKCVGALEFHHLDATQKDFSISDSNVYRNLEALKSEVDKCVLVCANCHREIHYN